MARAEQARAKIESLGSAVSDHVGKIARIDCLGTTTPFPFAVHVEALIVSSLLNPLNNFTNCVPNHCQI